tara:strand:+ start:6198 stop:6623 length:426 start_codon:yes stop_codon:yes gene_type:complete
MFKKFFKKKEKISNENANISIVALLINAAKIDENYTETEKEIIKKVIMELNDISYNESEKILKISEKLESESNQIVEFTKEIKKRPMEFRLKIIEILWKIVYSDGSDDNFESNLIRRVCGLLYVSDRDSGIIKTKIKNLSS